MRRMTPRFRSSLSAPSFALAFSAALLACGGLTSAACGGSQADPPGAAKSAGGGACATPRSAPECSAAAETKPFAMDGSPTKQQEVAVKRINDQMQALSDEKARLCGEYLACSIDDAAFQKGSASINERMASFPPLIEAMKSAKTYGEKKRALDGLYRGVVPAEKRVEELTFRMSMTAQLPESAGGTTIDVEPGGTLPTNTRASFAFEVSRDAYLYIFQKSPSGEVNVLFPDARIGTKNPLHAGSSVSIPPNGQRFRLNDKDLGTENVYLVASLTPIQSLDSSLEKVKAGKVTTITQDALLRGFTDVAPGTVAASCKTRAFELDAAPAEASSPECARSRGLVLDAPDAEPAQGSKRMNVSATEAAPKPMAAGSAGEKTSLTGRAVMEVRTDPGDNLIVKVFPFKHVTEAGFSEAAKAGPSNVKTRSIVIEF